jgi:hypothetical protein
MILFIIKGMDVAVASPFPLAMIIKQKEARQILPNTLK